MNQTLQILRKDWRRMRLWLYVWFAYLAVATAFAMRDPVDVGRSYLQLSFSRCWGRCWGPVGSFSKTASSARPPIG